MQVQLNVILPNGNHLSTPSGSPEEVTERIRGVVADSVNVNAQVQGPSDVRRLQKLLDVVSECWSGTDKK